MHGPPARRQGGVCKGQRPLLPVILSLTTDLCTVLIRSVLIVQSCTHMRQLITTASTCGKGAHKAGSYVL